MWISGFTVSGYQQSSKQDMFLIYSLFLQHTFFSSSSFYPWLLVVMKMTLTVVLWDSPLWLSVSSSVMWGTIVRSGLFSAHFFFFFFFFTGAKLISPKLTQGEFGRTQNTHRHKHEQTHTQQTLGFVTPIKLELNLTFVGKSFSFKTSSDLCSNTQPTGIYHCRPGLPNSNVLSATAATIISLLIITL